ncbi:M23 family metallopeptidase [Desulfovibrio sp.]|uniref:M23 family metallopeptidase n=1 Tax=Desulfovibrio sp. TaxID=885 RepID=UPI0025C26951|nr:M23 family metallopeptidase [Desulfovibrio sp.]
MKNILHIQLVRRVFTTLLPVLLVLVIFSGGPALAAPQVQLEAPATVARGDAFLALAVSNAAVPAFSFSWMGKKYTATALPVASASGAAQSWQAVILLPVPLDAKESDLTLGVSLATGQGGGKKSDAAAQVATQGIRLYDKDRPVQKLTVDKKYVNPPAAQMERIKADRELVRKTLAQYSPERLWALPFTRPVPGGVSSLFGLKRVFNGQPRGLHRGLDLRAAEGTPIVACADGRVALTGDLYFSGNVVYINHGEGVFTAYLHMSKILVTQGQPVRKGEVIGLVGATGRVTGPHLHLSLLVQGVSVDPQPFLAVNSAAEAAPPAASGVAAQDANTGR